MGLSAFKHKFRIYLLMVCFSTYPSLVTGLVRWPIFGSMLQIYWRNFKHPFMAVHQLVKELDLPMMSTYLGNHPVVFINDPDSIRELFSKPEFQGRSPGLVAKLRSRNKDKVLGKSLKTKILFCVNLMSSV